MRQKLLKQVTLAGNAALPALLRALISSVDAESRLAYQLLLELGGDRVARALQRLCSDPQVEDAAKTRVLGLLSDLRAPMPETVTLRDPEAMLAQSVRELLAGIHRPRERSEAVQLVIGQVPEAELPAFVAELVKHGGRKAAPLIAELRQHDGLSGETQAALAELHRDATATAGDRAATLALERALAYLEAGRPRAARRRLERFVAHHPDRPEGRSALGVCLLELNETELALEHLSAAAELEPSEALHRWNLASAAKQADRLGGCYLALRDYLGLPDEAEGAAERRVEAKSFARAYEKMLRGTHPGVPLSDVLRGEELFARAYAALSEGRHAEAARGFEDVLALVPRHYPSWGNLGAAYLALARDIEARRCLERALELNPDYSIARENLLRLQPA